jgi:predicted nucleic acid-binding protein
LKSIKIRALLDTNIFIYAYEIPESNSALVINALNSGLFEAVITESTFKEVYRYFRKHYHKRLADVFRIYLFAVCKIVYSYQLDEHSAEYAHLINEKDLEQVISVKEFGIKYLVSYDKHFEGIEEYRTPRQFAELLKLKARPVNY